MIISDGHARALLRNLVREHSTRARTSARAVGNALRALPDKRSRLGTFVEGVRHRLADDALFIHARCDKRRAALHAILAQFAETPAGWHLELQVLAVGLRPGRVPDVQVAPLPVRITGHALERMFQRTRSTDWRAIIAELEPAAVMMGWLYRPLIAMGFAQAAVQTRSGLLLGQVDAEGVVVFKTFLRADEADRERHAELRGALWGFWIRNGGGQLLAEALFACADAQARVLDEAADLLARHPWLACRHAAGEDQESERWRLARQASVAAG